MKTTVVPGSALPEEHSRRVGFPRQGIGVLLALVGSAGVLSASLLRGSAAGGAVAFLLLLVGSGLLIDRPRHVRFAH
jgi:hypothetical protein